MSKRPIRLIIDTDGGIDDALALILALRSPEVEVVGVSTVSGNVRVEQAAINVLRVIELFDHRDIWVAQGLGNPLVRDPIRATSFHGTDGLGDSNLPQPRMRTRKESAIDLIVDQLNKERDHGLTIVCIGPLTNIAAVLTNSPNISGRIGELLIMGGAFGLSRHGYGNVTPVAEFNIYSDPEAAKIVFESGIHVRAVGLDVTSAPENWLTSAEYSRVKATKNRVSVFAARILANTMQKRRMFELHDPIAIGAVIQPSLYGFTELSVKIETKGEYTTGMTVTERRKEADNLWTENPIKICTNLKSQRFKRLFLSHLLKN
ncbi:MAG TPA: nucleoside hydrolase [Candidatus Bathyarchaeia archaeon]|nr:nucleoside hydrolase [Candidatus Bathyarchaeia archaeon]